MEQNRIIIVKYRTGVYANCIEDVTLFATFDEEVAIKYVEKFNRILNKWQEYYRQFEEDGWGWIKDEYNILFNRWFELRGVSHCFYTKIKIR